MSSTSNGLQVLIPVQCHIATITPCKNYYDTTIKKQLLSSKSTKTRITAIQQYKNKYYCNSTTKDKNDCHTTVQKQKYHHQTVKKKKLLVTHNHIEIRSTLKRKLIHSLGNFSVAQSAAVPHFRCPRHMDSVKAAKPSY